MAHHPTDPAYGNRVARAWRLIAHLDDAEPGGRFTLANLEATEANIGRSVWLLVAHLDGGRPVSHDTEELVRNLLAERDIAAARRGADVFAGIPA